MRRAGRYLAARLGRVFFHLRPILFGRQAVVSMHHPAVGVTERAGYLRAAMADDQIVTAGQVGVNAEMENAQLKGSDVRRVDVDDCAHTPTEASACLTGLQSDVAFDAAYPNGNRKQIVNASRERRLCRQE